jgi:hypothetical protein
MKERDTKEDSMTGPPHPFVMTMAAAQRRANIQAEAERDRLGRLAQTGAERRPHWLDVTALAGIVLALALPFLA